MTETHPLFLAVLADPSPAPKLVLADWLEENDKPGLAYAFRWAGERGRHPYISPKGRNSYWDCKRRRGKEALHQLPRQVFDELPFARPELPMRDTLAAFEALAQALFRLRCILSLCGGGKRT